MCNQSELRVKVIKTFCKSSIRLKLDDFIKTKNSKLLIINNLEFF